MYDEKTNVKAQYVFPHTCVKCNVTQEKEAYYFSKTGFRSGYCRECQKAESRRRYDVHRDKIAIRIVKVPQ